MKLHEAKTDKSAREKDMNPLSCHNRDLNTKEKTNLKKKGQRYLSKKDIQIVKKHMKMYSTFFIIREIKITT